MPCSMNAIYLPVRELRFDHACCKLRVAATRSGGTAIAQNSFALAGSNNRTATVLSDGTARLTVLSDCTTTVGVHAGAVAGAAGAGGADGRQRGRRRDARQLPCG
eukprot:7885508-Pyramimonas_sp.AAC.1